MDAQLRVLLAASDQFNGFCCDAGGNIPTLVELLHFLDACDFAEHTRLRLDAPQLQAPSVKFVSFISVVLPEVV